MSVKGVKITGFTFFDSSIRLLLEVKLDNEKRTPGVKPARPPFYGDLPFLVFLRALSGRRLPHLTSAYRLIVI